ncbi:MAG: ABC transporter permease [Vicinamibacteraceae bacterium]
MAFPHLLQDLRYTVRTLRRDAGFAVFAVLIAGLGIGASATVFSVVNTLLLRPLPFAKPSELVWIANRDAPGLSGQMTQVGYLLDLREKTQTMSAVAGYFAFYGVGDNLLTGRGEPERLSGVPVSENFFDVLGVKPLLGRSFNAVESAWNGPKAVMLGHAIWERRFGRDPRIVGTSLVINDEPHTVVGVLPASFDFATVFAPGSRLDLYFPFALSPETNRWGNTMAMIGRVKPGATAAQAHAEVRALAPQMRREHPERNDFEGLVRPLSDYVSGNVRLAVVVLAGAVGMVMLIVCANLSNLLLARTAARRKEIAIRMSLGAGRKRLLTQMLTEGLVLSSAGAVLGLALALIGTRLLTGLDAVSIPLLHDVRIDGVALGFTVVITLITGVVFGLAPALQTSGAGMSQALKDATRGSTEGRERTWVRNALVVSEIAFACVLLVGAGLLIRSLAAVLEVQMGFDPARSATIRVDPDGRVTTPEQRLAYLDDVLRRVRQAPGIDQAGITDALPLGRNRTWGAGAKGVTYERGQYPLAFVRVVSEGYPAAMGVPVLAGRDLTASDMPGTEPVMLINKTLAEALWPGQNPIGQYINGGCGAKERRVVGVVGDVRHLSLEQPSGNEMYMPARQCLDLAGAYLVVRSSLPTSQIAATLRATLTPIAPNLASNDFRTMQQIVDRSTSPRRFTVLLLGGFAVFALTLASLGIYALISYSVNQRTQEIGIRMALGASTRDVQASIVGQTLRLAAIGLVLGAGASWLLARSASGLLFGVTARDPRTFIAMAAVLGAVALLAGYLPARRASRIDPMVALRAD